MVMDVASSGAVDPAMCASWENKSFLEIVSEDSRPKVDVLLQDNSARNLTEGRWRHLNLQGSDGTELPLLIKFFRFAHEGASTHLICARDLRPLSDAQQQWQHQQNALQQSYEDQLNEMRAQVGLGNMLHHMTKLVGDRPLNELATNALSLLETLCCKEALERSDGNLEAAAHMLGVSVNILKNNLKLE